MLATQILIFPLLNAIEMRQMPGLCERERIYDRSLRIRSPDAIEMPGEYEGNGVYCGGAPIS